MNWQKLLCSERPGEKTRPDHIRDTRSIFEQDFDRIIFSHPFRCLQDKTQVFPLAKTEFVHNRLTHSLEVSSVGRSLGKQAGRLIIERNPEIKNSGYTEFDFGAIVASASLAHDIGNPPFGHSGEEAISEFFLYDRFAGQIREEFSEVEWEDMTHYEGNAQGFRLLTRENYQGLKITFATLAAFSKYPRQSLLPDKNPERKSQKKFGFFQSEKEKFRNTAEKTGLKCLSDTNFCWTRHPLAFLVEAADDICYSIIDLEDGCNLGLVSMTDAKDLLTPILGKKFKVEKFNSLRDRREKISLLRAMVIAELVEQACAVFLDNEQEILNGDFDRALTTCLPAAEELRKILDISVSQIYRSTPVIEKEAAGFEVLSGLINSYLQAAYDFYRTNGRPKKKNLTIINLFPENLKRHISDNKVSFYEITMACLDYLTLMTDSLALGTYRKIKGITISDI